MKALLKGGLFLALGWLANQASSQETKWQATPRPSTPIVVASPQAGAADTGVRGVSLSMPVPLASGQSGSVVRGQMPEPPTLQPLPKIEIEVPVQQGGDKTKPLPKGDGKGPPLPKVNGGAKEQPKEFIPPPPTTMPSPIYDHLMPGGDDSCGSDLCMPTRCCRDAVFGLNGGCCPDRRRVWISGDYLMWWQKGQDTPPLVSSSPVGTPFNQIGVLPGATVLYDHMPEHTYSGGRVSAGLWMKHFCNLGIDGSFFFLGQINTSQTFTSDGTNLLGRPFTNIAPPPVINASEPFSTNTRVGFARIETYSQFWGADANLRSRLWCGPNCWIDGMVGYRHMSLREGIHITEDLTTLAGDPTAPAGLHFVERESFLTRNIFHGGQIGAQAECRLGGRWSLGVTTKVAFGTVTQIVEIDGSTSVSQNNVPVGTLPGALLATQTNMGRYQQSRYAVAGEVGFKVGYDLTDNLQVYVGYDLMYLSSVVRPGDQIDPVVNQSFRPFFVGAANVGERRPAVLFQTSQYWAQGLNFGMRYRY